MNNKVLFFLFLVCQEYFFGLDAIPSFVAKALALGTLFFAIKASSYKEKYFNKILLCWLICAVVNMLWCTIHRAQSPIEYFIGNEFTNMLMILGIFAIPAFKLSNKDIEKVLISLGFTCAGLYLVQYIFHIPLTGDKDLAALEETGLELRVRINGMCLFSLMVFWSLQRIIEEGIRLKYGVALVAGSLCLLIIGFRSQLAFLIVTSALFLWKGGLLKGRFIQVAVLSLVLGSFALQTEVVQFKINQMIERNETDNFENEDYVRFISYEHYTHVMPEGIGDKIIGIGLPNGNSTYGKEIQDLKNYHIIWGDWGLIGLSWVFGIPAVLCMIWYILHAFFTPVDKRYSYLCYWCLYMLLASIITREMYREGAFAVQAVVLFLIAQTRIDNARIEWKNLLRTK